jgi:DNA-directed RNA polymerase beta subunit
LFSDYWVDDVKEMLTYAGFQEDGKMTLLDWRSGMPFDTQVTVWYMHILKLIHMVEDKIHARSVWPYSLITQQPLWGKARQWWQRFWEMEVWALEAYSAVYTLQEMLTIKSDDVTWRNKAYEAIIKWWQIKVSGLPESFNLVVYLFKGLGQNIIPLSEEEVDKIHNWRVEKILELWLKWITWAAWVVDKSEVASRMKSEDEQAEKMAMMDTVVSELKEHGDIDE